MWRADDILPGRRGLLGLALRAAAGGLACPTLARAWGDAPTVCGSAPGPGYPPVDKPAQVQVWLSGGKQDGPLPDCGQLRLRELELVVRVTATYASQGELDDQLNHFGAVSSLKGMQYWSFTDRKRQVLIRDCYAVEQPSTTKPRPDYSAAELKKGEELFFVHSDNRSSNLVPFGLKLAQIADNGFTVRVENIGDIRFMGFTMLAARECQWAVSVEKLGPGRWGYRGLLGLKHLRLGRAEQHRLSNLSRAVAMFDLLAQRQTDIEGYR